MLVCGSQGLVGRHWLDVWDVSQRRNSQRVSKACFVQGNWQGEFLRILRVVIVDNCGKQASKALKEPRRLRDNDRIRFGVMTSFYR